MEAAGTDDWGYRWVLYPLPNEADREYRPGDPVFVTLK